jgi:UDP:flavonoid glycosyltransferase YjiC (YdhE family)
MMATFVFVTWNGGGNVTPALGIARALAKHRHTVVFLGEETQRRRIEATGFAFTAYTRFPDWDGAPPQKPAEWQRLLMRTIWMNDGLADDLTAVLARSPADMVIVDCMLAGILAKSHRFGVPTAVLVHSLFASVLDMRDTLLTMGNRLRVEAGLPALDAAAMQWERKDLVLVATLREFDGITDDPAPHVRYVGPVFERQLMPPDWRLPWDRDDQRPLVVTSFSTMPGQTSPARLQQVLDSLESLPLHILLATGPFPPEILTVPPNAAVFGCIPHMVILPHAALAINHAGHGSVMAALAHGVPLVCMPSLGADQDIIARRVEALGAGIAIHGQARANELRSAVEQMMAVPAYRVAAERMAMLIGREDGAVNGASALEACLP